MVRCYMSFFIVLYIFLLLNCTFLYWLCWDLVIGTGVLIHTGINPCPLISTAPKCDKHCCQSTIMAPPPKGPRGKSSSNSSPNLSESERNADDIESPPERDTLGVCVHDGCIYNRLYEGKDMVRCCHYARWYHVECIKNREAFVTGVWPCFTCRTMPDDMNLMKDSLNNLSRLVMTLAQTIQALQKDQ